MSALKSVTLSLKYPSAKIKKSKHKKLDEDFFETRESIQDGMRFMAKYLGVTLITEPNREDMSETAVQRIINSSKGTRKPTVQLVVSANGIQVFDPRTSQLTGDISITRISYCAALRHHMKIFAFVAQSHHNKQMECHAYLCNTVKEAQSLTFTVAQSFKFAYEIGEELSKNTADDVHDSKFIEINKDKKSTSVSVPTITERRYQRFSSESNPFDTSDSESKLSADIETGDVESNGFPTVFTFTEPTAAVQKNDVPITPLRPPPSRNGEKPTGRRTSARPSSVGSPFTPTLYQITGTPPMMTPENEDLDKDFADLALSRTKEVEKSGYQNAAYPPSNPFFSPSNPFQS